MESSDISITVRIPASLDVNASGLAYHVRKALDLYTKANPDRLTRDFARVLADPCSVYAWPPQDLKAGNRPEDKSGVRGLKGSGLWELACEVPVNTPAGDWQAGRSYNAAGDSSARPDVEQVDDVKAILDGKPMTPLEIARMLQRLEQVECEVRCLKDDEIETLDDTVGKQASQIKTLQECTNTHARRLESITQGLVRTVQILARAGNPDAQDLLNALENK